MPRIANKVVKAALRVLPLDSLQVDPSYQRDVKAKHKKIVAEFNPDALGLLLVGQRGDGSLWVVDGLQRVTALKKLSRKDVRAEVFKSRGPEHEAEVFKLVNVNRTTLTPGERFRALLTSHDKTAWAIKEAVEGCGFRLGLTTNGGVGRGRGESEAKSVVCIAALQRIAKTCGVESISFALTVVDRSWPGDRLGIFNIMLQGLAIFHVREGPTLDTDRLVSRLQTITPQKVLYAANHATLSTDKSFAVAQEIERAYHKRLSPKRGS